MISRSTDCLSHFSIIVALCKSRAIERSLGMTTRLQRCFISISRFIFLFFFFQRKAGSPGMAEDSQEGSAKECFACL